MNVIIIPQNKALSNEVLLYYHDFLRFSHCPRVDLNKQSKPKPNTTKA